MEEQTQHEHPLFSCFISLYTLILLYLPLQILLSPVLLISVALIVFLLRLGSNNTRPGKIVNLEEEEESRVFVNDSKTKLDSSIGDFVEWDLRAPLEVIHEAYEYDDEEEEKDPTRFSEMDRFDSLSLCYPESDSDSNSDSDYSSDFNYPEIGNEWISREKMGLKWEEEDDGGLIEIKLDEYNRKSKWNQTQIDFHAEEEGLIEIDIFP
ncbi:hypothetical protein AALP_AA7G039800 [Arabis alpina]|uniref:Transmembrane protein n=1 Tax=Arabis alpina TaxID=50452 RepID=A0A087GFT0_ARAAL|nr:hypothetical protein AALP_AA7G039800 [Arabis alpina]